METAQVCPRDAVRARTGDVPSDGEGMARFWAATVPVPDEGIHQSRGTESGRALLQAGEDLATGVVCKCSWQLGGATRGRDKSLSDAIELALV